VLRFVASVLITSGILMLADAGLTLAWQEPVSAFFAAREQGRLAHKLDVEAAGVVARDKLLVASIRDIRKRLARLGAIERQRARTGDPIGRIKLPTLGRHYVVVQGTDLDTLRKGPGHYPKTVFPGEAGTVGALPALLNAVNDALAPLGVRHLDMPVTSERVWRAIQDAKARR